MTLEEGEDDVRAGMVAAVVTHLEMVPPVAPRPVPLPGGLTLRKVRSPSLGWYRDLFTRVGTLDWLWISRLRMDDETLAAILDDPRVEVMALEADGRAEGLLELDFRQDGACEIAFLGLSRDVQGLGAGRALMAHAIARAAERPVARLHVHTCTLDSPAALPFYLRSGFRAVRRAVQVFEDPRPAGLVPAAAAPQVPVIAAAELPG